VSPIGNAGRRIFTVARLGGRRRTAVTLRALLQQQQGDLALVVGNGINRYGAAGATNSWNDLIHTLARKRLGPAHAGIPTGLSLTEFYDLLDLAKPGRTPTASLQQAFCDLMGRWQPHDQHRRVMRWALAARVPVLTTNFEGTLADAVGGELHRLGGLPFTDFYPWDCYYGLSPLADPCAGFGIWHINGTQAYRRSIRLGLTHYMGSVARARAWIHAGGTARLYGSRGPRAWTGATTWLHILFHKPLVILGLGLAESEVFLRWLLIERARYFRKFPDRRKRAWYIHTAKEREAGKLYFLDAIGIEPLAVPDFDTIYRASTWTSGTARRRTQQSE
jgi:hypothetical protein